jgi:RNA polymerase sigma-70 factor (ECF subfamily)
MTDSQLVRQVLEGDTRAFAGLVDRHAPVCLRYATRMLGDRDDAEEVTQDALLRAYRALSRYDGSVAFRTWLMTILVNRCRSALLLRRRREGRVVADSELVARSPAPAADGEFGWEMEEVRRAVDRLDPEQREAFLLRHVEELSYDEMTAITGAGTSALKMRVKRACARLRTLLENDHG